MTITTTTSHDTSKRTLLDSFTFDDGATVRVAGGLVCSQHGRRHCAHHKAAHNAIVAKAASDDVATTAAMEAAEAFDADYDAWLDSLPPSCPTPDDLSSDDDEEPPPDGGPQFPCPPKRFTKAANHVYLLHFTAPVAHARHYLGSTNDLSRRLAEHRDPTDASGARLPHVAVIRGAELLVARTWRGGRGKERAIKEAYKHAFTMLCPLCHQGAGSLPKNAKVTKYA